MFKSYLMVALRNLYRHKMYSAIGVIGLSLGITCCLLSFLYVRHELSFDSFHANGDHIYRVIQMEADSHELAGGTSSTSTLLREALKTDVSAVERATLITGAERVVTRGAESFTETVMHVDGDFLRMFSFPLLRGDSATALDDPSSVVLTPDMAQKYFGREDPIGKTVSVQLGEANVDLIVSAIIGATPVTSSIQYDCLVSASLLEYTMPENVYQSWDFIVVSTFVQLTPGVDIAQLETVMSQHISGLASTDEEKAQFNFYLQPLADIHLDPRFEGEAVPSSDPIYYYILSAIALAILAIASINFVTLSVGRSSARVREVGLRKVLGARRGQLMKQFWGEPILLCITAAILGVALTEGFLPTFSELAQRQLTLDLFSNWTILPTLLAVTLITAFLAGIYPALLLSGLGPTDAMRGSVAFGGRRRMIQALVVSQFALSVFLILGTLVISAQLDFISNTSLGYNKEFVVTVATNSEGEEAADLVARFRNKLGGQQSIADITGYSYPFGQSWLYIRLPENGGTTVLIGEDVTGPAYSSTEDTAIYFYINWIDPHYIPTMGIKVIAGRNFSEQYPSDQNGAILINETAARQWGLDNPVGQKLPKGFGDATIVGVVEDFHYYPLHRKVDPLVFHMPRHDNLSSLFEIAVRIRSDDIPAALARIENTWEQTSNGRPFAYRFLDETVEQQYSTERRWRRIVRHASVLSILITCLGLFGLTSLAAAKRTREVGIRKVLGASESSIVRLISREFVVLACVGIALATPMGLYFMNRWLDRFAYHAGIGWGAITLAGGVSLAIALASVSFQALKAARANPVESLKYE